MKSVLLQRLSETLATWLALLNDIVTPKQRKAALAAGAFIVVLLVAAIVFVILNAAGALRPRPSNAVQLAYVLAVEAEDKAVAAARGNGRSVDTDTDVVNARADIVNASIALGQYASAQKLANRLADANPKNGRAVAARAFALQARGEDTESVAAFAAAADVIPETETELRRSVLAGWGQALAVTGQERSGLDVLTSAAAIQPASAGLYEQAGQLAEKLEDWQTAAEDYYRAQAFSTDDVSLDEVLARLEREHPRETAIAKETVRA
ncbi:MAG: hypothetical protein LBJ07_04200, partial [Actinomycetes bacterium]|nr:hypothetical protein [Actinomycetes bacterium]